MKTKPLPPSVRKWLLEERLLTAKMITRAGLRYAEMDHNRIAIPNQMESGKVVCWKCRIAPGIEVDKKNKWLFSPKGKKSPVYGMQFWKKDATRLYLCEGELDCLLLNQHEFDAFTSVTGVEIGRAHV